MKKSKIHIVLFCLFLTPLFICAKSNEIVHTSLVKAKQIHTLFSPLQSLLTDSGNIYLITNKDTSVFTVKGWPLIHIDTKKEIIFCSYSGFFGILDIQQDSLLFKPFLKKELNEKEPEQILQTSTSIFLVASNNLYSYNNNKVKKLSNNLAAASFVQLKKGFGFITQSGNMIHIYKNKVKNRSISTVHDGYLLHKSYLWYALFSFLIILTAFFIICKIHRRTIRQKNELIQEFDIRKAELINRNQNLIKKHKKNEELLANLLPSQTADEIRSRGKAVSHRFELVTVLFADIEGFTKIAETINPEILIDELDKIFFYFDSVVEKYNIEKIKTIGDAYMCAGGIPQKNRTNPVDVVLAALDMRNHLKFLHQNAKNNYTKIWNIRIGIHTGPVITGVIGKKKFSYDVWGDSVNVASRMESSGSTGKVNISGKTYELVEEFFDCDYRGRMPVKYKGEIEMYFVNGILPELSENGEGLNPNREFKTRLALIQFDDLADEILEKKKDDFIDTLYYHNAKYIKYLILKVEILGLGEHVSDVEMLLLKTAALIQPLGFTYSYIDSNQKAIEIATKTLPKYHYSNQQIDEVVKLIQSTKQFKHKQNQLEQIFDDARFEYLGSFDYKETSLRLFNELKAYKKADSLKNFYRNQYEIVRKHEFYTQTAILLRDVVKEAQLNIINNFIKYPPVTDLKTMKV